MERQQHRDRGRGIISWGTNQPGSHRRPQPTASDSICFIHPLIQTATAGEEETRKQRREEEEDVAASESPCQRVRAWGLVVNRQLHCPFREMQFSSLKMPVLHASFLSPSFIVSLSFSSCRMIHKLLLLHSPSFSESTLSQPPPLQPTMSWLDAKADRWRLGFQHHMHRATPSPH